MHRLSILALGLLAISAAAIPSPSNNGALTARTPEILQRECQEAEHAAQSLSARADKPKNCVECHYHETGLQHCTGCTLDKREAAPELEARTCQECHYHQTGLKHCTNCHPDKKREVEDVAAAPLEVRMKPKNCKECHLHDTGLEHCTGCTLGRRDAEEGLEKRQRHCQSCQYDGTGLLVCQGCTKDDKRSTTAVAVQVRGSDALVEGDCSQCTTQGGPLLCYHCPSK